MSNSLPPQPDQVLPETTIAPDEIRSTSRSCLVVILLLLFIVLMLCVVFAVQTWM